MSRIPVVVVGEGQHPSEQLIEVKTASGQVRLIVDRRSIDNGSVDVGYPVASDDTRFLVELPRETLSGQWRVWMNRADLLEGVPA